jgi:hypothetical protein
MGIRIEGNHYIKTEVITKENSIMKVCDKYNLRYYLIYIYNNKVDINKEGSIIDIPIDLKMILAKGSIEETASFYRVSIEDIKRFNDDFKEGMPLFVPETPRNKG